MELSQNVRTLLGKIGFLACHSQMTKEARVIFDALEAIGEGRPGPIIGQAMALMEEGKFDEAVALLNEKAGGDQLAKAYSGLALFMGKKIDEAKVVLQDVISSGEDKEAVELAQAIMEETTVSK